MTLVLTTSSGMQLKKGHGTLTSHAGKLIYTRGTMPRSVNQIRSIESSRKKAIYRFICIQSAGKDILSNGRHTRFKCDHAGSGLATPGC